MPDDPRVTIGRTLTGELLEIGAGAGPFPTAADAHVRYVDRSLNGRNHADFPELVGEPDGVPVDYALDLDRDGLAPIPDGSLDGVIIAHVIEHLANPLAALEEIHRVLRPHGRLVLVVPDRNVTFDSVRPPTPFSTVLAKYRQNIREVSDDEIRAFCAAVFPEVREWHDRQALEILALHRRRTIHVHCWTPEEFASLIAASLFEGLPCWRFRDLYMPAPPREIEFGLVLERSSIASGAQFITDWARAVLLSQDHRMRIARFVCALERDLDAGHRREAEAALSSAIETGDVHVGRT